ncbi:RNA-binding protein [Candidatus Woesearchaeota archaeon]|nr:RNA-binding protein [Candidatus Woesearchaeota archaeon]
MGKILFKDKDLVVPGDILAEGMDYLPSGGCVRKKDKIVADHLGLVSLNKRFVNVIPLTGNYIPKIGDTVIAEVVDMGFNGWYLNVGGPYEASLMLKDVSEFIEKDSDLSQFYNFGDLIIAKVSRVTRYSNINLTTKGPGLRNIKGGKVISVTPSKVPRIIGKQGSMVQLLKEKTNCKIVVGQNGKIWIEGNDSNDELKVTEAILMIEHESHTDGLTDKIKAFLESKK